jgi:uncharacterized protein with NAD-binding domain and iron-sulfur cluster
MSDDQARERPIEVAVIGGGCAAMTAAFELTRPEHRGKYHVTVYQMGWRLGGKGASGRGPADRIEEHGLHLWMGFYENAFRLMRECYAELGRDPARCRIATWEDAFKPNHFNAVADRTPRGDWLPWTAYFPPLPGLPGDPGEAPPRWTVADYMTRTALLSRYFLEGIRVRAGEGGPTPGPTPEPAPAPVLSPGSVMEGIGRLVRYGQIATLTAANEALRFLETALGVLPQFQEDLLIRFVDAISRAVRGQIEALVTRDDEARRLWELWDLTLAVIRGALRHRLMTDPRGFDAVNDYDCREWLRLNGASDRGVNSAFVRGLYDLAFAYEDGDVTRPRIAAGDALRGTLRSFFTYRGAFFWKMQSGMGDVVFAPLYEVLRRRGASFRFFHRLENVRIAEGSGGGRPHVSGLDFSVQAAVARGGEYEPLVDVRGLPCWPSEPRWEQLEGGRPAGAAIDFESHWDHPRVGSRSLEVGVDFDLCVLGIGLGAVPYVCKELVARDPRWRTMVEKVRTVPTQALQIWMREDMRSLGWRQPPVNISGFVEPFDTWADMSHLVGEESFRERVGAIAYFCSVLPDRPVPAGEGDVGPAAARVEEVWRNAERFLAHDIRHLWPGAVDARGEFRWDLLVDANAAAPSGAPGERVGAPALGSQYVRANVNPSDRYVLTLPGSSRYRISPLDDSYDNLTVAGDWTDCGLNEGCVESAVMSGRLAAHALSRAPALADITGFDHP